MPDVPVTATALIDRLALQPHPEGGWYREIYRSRQRVQTSAGPRSALTDIYYLLERGQQSRWHVVDADEGWHFYAGAPLQLYLYDPAHAVLTLRLLAAPGVQREPSAEPSAEPAAVVPAGVWQAARCQGDFSFVGCSVAPGFQFSGFRLVADLPDHARHFSAEPAAGQSLQAQPSLSLQSLRELL
ncbi:MAG TPA: cupin domain-containing protein [Steroidobacteraceae bacterium]|nr:cupin domain-containing protein [Steroidobacteraceae bacterium]